MPDVLCLVRQHPFNPDDKACVNPDHLLFVCASSKVAADFFKKSKVTVLICPEK